MLRQMVRARFLIGKSRIERLAGHGSGGFSSGWHRTIPERCRSASRTAPHHVPPDQRGQAFDYVIKGASVAGCVIAHRLAESGKLR